MTRSGSGARWARLLVSLAKSWGDGGHLHWEDGGGPSCRHGRKETSHPRRSTVLLALVTAAVTPTIHPTAPGGPDAMSDSGHPFVGLIEHQTDVLESGCPLLPSGCILRPWLACAAVGPAIEDELRCGRPTGDPHPAYDGADRHSGAGEPRTPRSDTNQQRRPQQTQVRSLSHLEGFLHSDPRNLRRTRGRENPDRPSKPYARSSLSC